NRWRNRRVYFTAVFEKHASNDCDWIIDSDCGYFHLHIDVFYGRNVKYFNLRWISFRTRNDGDRKSTRLNSSHVSISYAVFCLKKKKNKELRQSEEKTKRR